ncbi:hypothetical protein [Thalassotalea mangrovi]|uniref:Porin n=1 Tax=Thalassotalea mangrovi TaxID=2572245 RepID=A0A4U1B1R8_9GAMM|nr:hypothetical protein [Thalassotalea mangrovi]TKB43141.1 hypothetical protein E8M12_15790 [Thalassotalea mangrovi]
MSKLQNLIFVLGCLSLIVSQARANDNDASLSLGGAIRGNYSWLDYGDDANGNFDFELFRLDLGVEKSSWFVDIQYRWYKTFDAVHHAEFGYKFSESNILSAGITQVPFGLEPYASHSFWFGGTYYLGLEDDYDTGVKWRIERDNWVFDTAYFIHSEYDNPDRWDRYSFDLASPAQGEPGFKEDGQFNIRAQYRLGKHLLGTSIQTGRFTNTANRESGDHWAIAVHADGHFANDWNAQLQYIKYYYEDNALLSTEDYRITLVAFEAPFEIASEADVISFNLAKTFQINNAFLDSVTCYNDHTYIAAPRRAGLTDSIQNVTGCSLVKGGIYTYIDWIAGKNMWFAGGPGVGIADQPSKWHSRLNINLAWYF